MGRARARIGCRTGDESDDATRARFDPVRARRCRRRKRTHRTGDDDALGTPVYGQPGARRREIRARGTRCRNRCDGPNRLDGSIHYGVCGILDVSFLRQLSRGGQIRTREADQSGQRQSDPHSQEKDEQQNRTLLSFGAPLRFAHGQGVLTPTDKGSVRPLGAVTWKVTS
jgi:hypothetical protein